VAKIKQEGHPLSQDGNDEQRQMDRSHMELSRLRPVAP
jgi:hypothetical protein